MYLCIDLKSFYASVECVERGLDPMTTKLAVADPDRSDKSICLAVSPAMKKLGVKNRCRVFEIPRDIKYIMAPPRMKKYIDYAAEIYGVYLKYFSKDDIHVYSIDEAFMDTSRYSRLYECSETELALRIMDDIEKTVGIRATCGVGTNLYLTKIALDILAKHSENFVGFLNEEIYRKTLWRHVPLTDFWRIGPGISGRLSRLGIYTMQDIAEADEELLYRIFGVDAELIIDHAWGREPVTIRDVKEYKPKSKCISNGQVLMRDYTFREGLTIIKEMAYQLCLRLIENNLMTYSVTISVGYAKPYYGMSDSGTVRFTKGNADSSNIVRETAKLYERVIEHSMNVRRMYVVFNNLGRDTGSRQISFDDLEALEKKKIREEVIDRDFKIQRAVLDIKKRYGKNSLFKGIDLLEEATTRERNMQIGGHKSGEE